jgi:hypothetical protein
VSRTRFVVAALACVCVCTGIAMADEGSGDAPPAFGENAPHNYESPQRFNLEIKFGPYSPNIDASPGLTGTPFADLFPPDKGKTRPPGRLLTSVEFDYEFLHRRWGTLAVGHTAGYYRRTTASLQYATVNGNDMVSCTFGSTTAPCMLSTGDTTALNILPLSIEAVYRFDYFAQRYHIPFVPYFKIGLAYYIWWIENGGGAFSIAHFDYTGSDGKTHSDSGFGGTLGWVMHPGGAFLLDVIDLAAARVMDAELGINHTYLFCEFSYAAINGFGAAGKMNLSDTTLNAGLAFQF